MRGLLAAMIWLSMVAGLTAQDEPTVVIAQGEQFEVRGANGWRVTPQDESYASHSYGGMWVVHGAVLGAPPESAGAVAVKTVNIPVAGKFRVWSKYQAPPYFNYLHKIEIYQGGKQVFSHVYGKMSVDRMWSFSGSSDELWWPWGVDHDAAEAPPTMPQLAAGLAEIRLITVANPEPAGDRFVDFVVLTTSPDDNYRGRKPYRVATPFANEAFAATKLYMRFRNTSGAAAQLEVSRAGHFQPSYGGARAKYPEAAVAPNAWSAWFNIGPFCRLVHNEGVWLKLPGATEIPVQLARHPGGKELAGDTTVRNGEALNIPLDIVWNKAARAQSSREIADAIVADSKTWPKANGGKKAKKFAFYGAFRGKDDFVMRLKDAIGYNTLLPDNYDHLAVDGYHQHAGSPAKIRAFAATVKDKSKFRVLSFGDEVHLGGIRYNDKKLQEPFRQWLRQKKVGKQLLGVDSAQASLAQAKDDPRLRWYATRFGEEQRFAHFRDMTKLAEEVFGSQVLTGANYSPHNLTLYYGPLGQWIDLFRHGAVSMYWSEDYIFSIPEPPQMLSWHFAMMQCAVRYNGQPIHYYVMPHAPGQTADMLRRNMIFSAGAGAVNIDSFWMAPQEGFTENFVAWNYPDSFKALHDSIYDTAEAEDYLVGGKRRPARIALLLSRATDYNESAVKVPKADDQFMARCKNAPAQTRQQTICRKDQQLLYMALRQAQHEVDLITEDDIAERNALAQYKVLYFAGEWIDSGIIPKLERWVRDGGILHAEGGLGHLNQFGEPEQGLLRLLGLKSVMTDKDLYICRTLLELPVAKPIDTIHFEGAEIAAVGMRQRLMPAGAKVLAAWRDGSPAATVNSVGKGKAYAIGGLAGLNWMKTALKVVPWARGGRKNLYHPVDFAPAAAGLAGLGLDEAKLPSQATCSSPHAEATLMDSARGTVVTIVNWSNGPLRDMTVSVEMPAAPKLVRSVRQQKSLPAEFAGGRVSFRLDLADADYILLGK